MSMDTTASLLLKKQLAELMKSPDSGDDTFEYFIQISRKNSNILKVQLPRCLIFN